MLMLMKRALIMITKAANSNSAGSQYYNMATLMADSFKAAASQLTDSEQAWDKDVCCTNLQKWLCDSVLTIVPHERV